MMKNKKATGVGAPMTSSGCDTPYSRKTIVHHQRKKRNRYGLTILVSACLGFGLHLATTPVSAAPELPAQPETVTAFYALSTEERDLIEATLMSECAYEPYAGQVAVAQCILDGCQYLGIRPDECVRVYQYAEASADEPSQSVKDAVSAVFDSGYRACEEDILFFYAPAWVESPFHESQHFVLEIGGHRFFEMAG